METFDNGDTEFTHKILKYKTEYDLEQQKKEEKTMKQIVVFASCLAMFGILYIATTILDL